MLSRRCICKSLSKSFKMATNNLQVIRTRNYSSQIVVDFVLVYMDSGAVIGLLTSASNMYVSADKYKRDDRTGKFIGSMLFSGIKGSFYGLAFPYFFYDAGVRPGTF